VWRAVTLLLVAPLLGPVACSNPSPTGPPPPSDAAVADHPPPPAVETPVCSITLALEVGSPALPEPGPPGSQVPAGDPGKLAPAELAARLSRLLWGREPEAAFVDKVAACPPRHADHVGALAFQMLKDQRAHAGVEAFFTWWLALDRVAGLEDPALTSDLRAAMAAEPARFGAHVVLEGSDQFATLLLAPFTVINEPLARLYGLGGVAGTDFREVRLDGQPRMGLLTQAGLLVQGRSGGETSPTERGRFLRERLLCQPIPDHPPQLAAAPLPAKLTRREALAPLRADPLCNGCHELVDPAGLAFERYDVLGRYRETDQGEPIDPAGELVNFEPMGKFVDALGLARLLAQSRVPARCFADKWLEYAAGRPLEYADNATVQPLEERYGHGGTSIRALIAEVTRTAQFLAVDRP
jgi:uncharacterized protein DUF1588/uncharacterized protein DUF1592/uncharacterized protein DUF1585